MNVNDLVLKLNKEGVVRLENGEVIARKKLSGIIAGIPVYDMELSYQNNFVTKNISDINEIYKEAGGFSEIPDMKVCSECGEIIGYDYYINQEEDLCFCSSDCLEKWMDSTFGEGNWKVKDFCTETFQIKISDDEAQALDDCVTKEGGFWWRDYDIMHVKNLSPESCFECMGYNSHNAPWVEVE